jgi:rubrerythrin
MAMPRYTLSRKSLLAWSAGGGAALLLPRAVRADTAPDGDLAYLRLLIGTELLAIDFYTRARAAKHRPASAAGIFKQLLTQEKAHYTKLALLLTDAGQVPATSDDVDFRYPRGGFASARSLSGLAWKIESLLVGAYLGAIEAVQTAGLRLPIGQIAASEAHHLSVIAATAKRSAIGSAFPKAYPISTASNVLDGYES